MFEPRTDVSVGLRERPGWTDRQVDGALVELTRVVVDEKTRAMVAWDRNLMAYSDGQSVGQRGVWGLPFSR